MALGPGKYDDICTFVRAATHAEGVVVIVIDGEKGSGFSMQAGLGTTLQLADLLDHVVQQMRKDLEKGL